MSLAVETRKGRVLYNIEVTLRMVDQLLAELGGGSLPVPTSPCERSAVDRVANALMLVESIGTGDSHVTAMEGRLRDRLKRELRALLRNLSESAVVAPLDASSRSRAGERSSPSSH